MSDLFYSPTELKTNAKTAATKFVAVWKTPADLMADARAVVQKVRTFVL